MFGLLMAVGVFSVLAQQWAKRDLARLEAERAERQEAVAQDAAAAVEFAILTETTRTFSQDIDLNRVMPHTARNTTIRDDESLQLVTRQGEESFDLTSQRIAIATGQDPLARAALAQTPDADALANAGDELGIAVIDTSAVRRRQIETSRDNMEAMASHIYDFYAGHLRFPTPDEYDALAGVFHSEDVWGSPLIYTYNNDNSAELAFMTPWGYRQSVALSLED